MTLEWWLWECSVAWEITNGNKKKRKKNHASLSLLASSDFFPNDCTDAQKSLMFDPAVLREWSAHWNVSADWNCSPITKTILWPSLQDRALNITIQCSSNADP